MVVIGAKQQSRRALFSEFKVNGRGSFTVITKLVWTTADWRVLGTTTLKYDQRGDYVCAGRFAGSACGVHAGYVYLTSPGL